MGEMGRGRVGCSPGLPPTAYKEKMKELSVLSLICSCFYSQPHPNTIYQYGGECAHSPSCGLLTPWLGWLLERGFGGEGLVRDSGLQALHEQPHPLAQASNWMCAGNQPLHPPLLG